MGPEFSHLDEHGRMRFVDVSAKPITRRKATAEGRIRMKSETLAAIRSGDIGKGNVLSAARLAAVGGAKQTASLIPLCHPLPLDALNISIEADDSLPGLRLEVTASAEARTGVEMEALCAVSTGLLAVYDMCKAVDRGIEILGIRLLAKDGGASGSWRRPVESETDSGSTA